MAIFFLRVQTVRRAAGRSIVAAAAYRAGERIADQRTGQTFDYSRRKGVVTSGLVGWEGSREALWNAAEAAEKRRDAVVGREVLVALPHELSAVEREALLQSMAAWLCQRHGVAADWCMHSPDADGDDRNWHGHILITCRRVDAGRLEAKTLELDRRPASRHSVEAMRQAWCRLVNEQFARRGIRSDVDSRSYVRQAADGKPLRSPVVTLGPTAIRSARRGGRSTAMFERGRRCIGRVTSLVLDEMAALPEAPAANRGWRPPLSR